MKLDAADGHTLWQRWIDGPAHLDDRGWSLVVRPDGDPVLTGWVPTSATEAAFYVARLRASDGGTVWARTLPGAIYNPDDRSGWLALLDDGDVILGNKTWSPATSYDVVLHRFAGADGADVWHRQHNSGGTAVDEPRAMIRDRTGEHVYLAGVQAGNYMALKFRAADGGLEWTGSYNGPPGWYDAASGVLEGLDGEIIVSGYSSGSSTGWDATTVAFDPDSGARLWVERYDAGHSETEETPVMALNAQGNLFVAGYAYGPATYSDMLALNYFLPSSSGAPAASSDFGLRVYPNPFRDRLSVEFSLPEEAPVHLRLIDVTGRCVARLRDEHLPAGAHRTEWHRTGPESIPAGAYWVEARAGGVSRWLRVVRVR